MDIDEETILKVLALFDEDDIKYIHSDILDKFNLEKEIDKPKIKIKRVEDEGKAK